MESRFNSNSMTNSEGLRRKEVSGEARRGVVVEGNGWK